MPGKSQSHTDAVLNVLRGTDLTGVAPYVGLFSSRLPMTLRGHGTGWQRLRAPSHHVRRARDRRWQRPEGREHEQPSVRSRAANWSEAVAFGIFASLAGALLYWDTLPTPKTVEQDDYGQFAVGALVVKED